MKVHLINAWKDRFLKHVNTIGLNEYLLKYESLDNFTNTWDLSALKLEEIFDQSFHSRISGRLWGGSFNSSKSMMLSFIETNREFVRSMFRDLEDENKDLSMRVNRFLLHCDEMLLQLQKSGKKINDHYHTKQTVSLYLAFFYPDKYTFFDYDHFSLSMKKFEARQMPEAYDIEKFFRLSATVYKLISKDDELTGIYSLALEKEGLNFDQSPMLMISDFYEYVSNS
ncbi:MAG: hypothetical protein HKO89_06780 [Saprospiraceae bacterium]|nr:hypothetical protein [Saprospiraceae bacterium]